MQNNKLNISKDFLKNVREKHKYFISDNSIFEELIKKALISYNKREEEYLDFSIFLEETIRKYINAVTKKAEKLTFIINNFISENFDNEDDFQVNLKNFQKLDNFFEQYDIYIESLNLEDLINSNIFLCKSLIIIVENINENTYKKIRSNNLTQLIYYYAKINNINNKWINKICSTPINPYDDKAQRDLVVRVKNGDKQAKNLLIVANDKLIMAIVNRYMYKIENSALDFDDLFQEGRMGLLKAVENFDFSKTTTFTTYAVWYIRKEITRYIDNNSRTIRIPVYLSRMMSKITNFESEYFIENACYPSLEIISEALDIKIDKLKEINRLEKKIVSLNEKIKDDEEKDFYTFFKDDSINVEQDSIIHVQIEKIVDGIKNASTISERNKQIIMDRYGFIDGIPHTLQEVGKPYNFSREWVRKLIKKELGKIGYDDKLNQIK